MSLKVSLLLTAILFWTGQLTFEKERVRLRDALRATPEPLLVNGLTLSLQRGVQRVVHTNGPALVFVSADQCRFTRAQLPVWLQFIAQNRLPAHVNVLLISLRGDEVPLTLSKALTPLHIEHQQINVADGFLFGRATGLTFSPAILALDRKQRVRFVTTKLTAYAAEELQTVLSDL